jgi:light-regulated signal transduction histidine kinase (bacteriophytochrome)
METAEEVRSGAVPDAEEGVGIQAAGYLLELSLDWIVLRASENIHHLLGESHVTLIDEPLGRFVHAQALHDLRNLFSRLSGTTGVGRAYGVRLTDEHKLVDVAFQLSDGRVLLEAVPSHDGFGECFGTVGGLIDGLSNTSGKALLDGGARRMRALTGYDRVTVTCGGDRAESSRGAFPAPAQLSDDLPPVIADVEGVPVAVFPRGSRDTSVEDALLRAPARQSVDQLKREGVRSCLRVPFSVDNVSGEFRCDSRTPRAPHFELHAAAELFAQLFAMRLEIDRFRTADQPAK